MMDSEIRLAIGSSLDNLELVQMVVQETLARLDLSTEATYEIGMAVREAVWSYGWPTREKVSISSGFVIRWQTRICYDPTDAESSS
jgi:hypothetical protein